MGLIDGIGNLLGLNFGVFGAIIGIGLVFLTYALLAAFSREQGPAIILIILAVCMVNVVLGLWPTWIIVILAVLGGLMAWRMLTGAGNVAGE